MSDQSNDLERALAEMLKCEGNRRECRAPAPTMDGSGAVWHGHRCPARLIPAVAQFIREREASLVPELEALRAQHRTRTEDACERLHRICDLIEEPNAEIVVLKAERDALKAEITRTLGKSRSVLDDEFMRQQAELTLARAALERANKWIVGHAASASFDWACAECAPASEILVAGFKCVYHEALAAYEKGKA